MDSDGCPGNMGEHGNGNQGQGKGSSEHSCNGHNEVVFSPVVPTTTTSTTTSNSFSTTTTTSATSRTSTTAATCSSGKLTLNSGNGEDEGDQGGLAIAPGQCLDLTFSGSIAFGQSAPITPSTQAGQSYIVHVIASNNGEMMLGCTLPLTARSCTAVNGEGHSD